MSELGRRRSEVIAKFLDDNAELFSAAAGDDVDVEGPEMVTGAILILRSRYAGGEGELSCYVQVPYALGHTELIGMVQHTLWRMHPAAGDEDD